MENECKIVRICIFAREIPGFPSAAPAFRLEASVDPRAWGQPPSLSRLNVCGPTLTARLGASFYAAPIRRDALAGKAAALRGPNGRTHAMEAVTVVVGLMSLAAMAYLATLLLRGDER